MALVINYNQSSLSAQRHVSGAQFSFQGAIEQLSSGLRINKAADDTAGLAVSEKLKNQVRGLNQAQRNAQDAVSLLQTAEGALNETHSILARMRELAVQSANDTLTNADRLHIQDEINQLLSEVDRIAAATQFNTIPLLRGSGVGILVLLVITLAMLAAFGAFFIPKSYGTSIGLTGGVEAALWGFLIFYVSCLVITWGFYTRKGGLLYDIERQPPAAPSSPITAATPAQ